MDLRQFPLNSVAAASVGVLESSWTVLLASGAAKMLLPCILFTSSMFLAPRLTVILLSRG